MEVKPNAHIILGWGVDEALIELANKCLSSIPISKAKGIVSTNKSLFYYPSPLLKTGKENWLENILKII